MKAGHEFRKISGELPRRQRAGEQAARFNVEGELVTKRQIAERLKVSPGVAGKRVNQARRNGPITWEDLK